MRSHLDVSSDLDFAPSPDCHVVGVAERINVPRHYPLLLMNGDFNDNFSF